MSAYTVSKGAFGKRSVSFTCPKCGDGLKCTLESAGESAVCPNCKHAVVIPGIRERDADRAARKAEQDYETARQVAEVAAKREAAIRRQKAAEEADAKAESERRKRLEAKRNTSGVSANAAAGVSLATVIVACLLMYFVAIRPLKVKLDAMAKDLEQARATINANVATANRNIDKIGRDLQSLQNAHDSLVGTVNYNANVANSNNRRY